MLRSLDFHLLTMDVEGFFSWRELICMLNNFSGNSVNKRMEAKQKVGTPVRKLFLVYERDGQDSSTGD